MALIVVYTAAQQTFNERFNIVIYSITLQKWSMLQLSQSSKGFVEIISVHKLTCIGTDT